MNIVEFRDKKYGNILVDNKKLISEFNKNEKSKKKYFALKNKGLINSFEFKILKNDIIW